MNHNSLPYDYFFCRAQKGKYINPYLLSMNRSLTHHVNWALGKYNESEKCQQPPSSFSYPKTDSTFNEEKPSVVWVNHSTFLLSVHGYHILTDPVFCHCTSPVKGVGPKRKHSPGISKESLPPISFVIISHNHYDHLDEESVQFLHKRNPNIHWIVPMGIKKWFVKRGIHKVDELNWWQAISISKGKHAKVKVTSVPAQHYSGRVLVDFNKTLWMGCVFESDNGKESKKVYFSGDTGYNEFDFKKIGECFGKIDLSLIPIGVYSPREFMRTVHVDPIEAVEIHKDVNSSFSIGMHWNTFSLSDEPTDRPPYDLFLTMQNNLLDPKDFIATDPGVYHNW